MSCKSDVICQAPDQVKDRLTMPILIDRKIGMGIYISSLMKYSRLCPSMTPPPIILASYTPIHDSELISFYFSETILELQVKKKKKNPNLSLKTIIKKKSFSFYS